MFGFGRQQITFQRLKVIREVEGNDQQEDTAHKGVKRRHLVLVIEQVHLDSRPAQQT